MLNQITLMGRFVRDPELRHTQQQTPVCSFTLAVDRDFGEKTADFIDCVVWNATAEFVSKYFRKGSSALVTGELHMRDWTDKDGNKHRNAEVIVNRVWFTERKHDETASSTFDDLRGDGGDLPF